MRLMRVLLVWLLVLALPVQGAAAAVMASCGPGHHGAAAMASAVRLTQPAQASPAHALTAVDHDHPAHHDHPADPDVAEPHASAATDASTADHASHGTEKKCSACASCCSMSALPSPLAALPIPDLAPTVFNCVVPRVDPYAADGLERPPRSPLA